MQEVRGASMLRHVLASSLLSRKPVTITHIHPNVQGSAQQTENPHLFERNGLQLYEANLLKFIDKITTGTKMEVTDGTTKLVFHPGQVVGGGEFTHEVPSNRCVTYLMELALLVLPFGLAETTITFVGSTQSPDDLSVDTFRTVTSRWVQLFGIECNVRIARRGAFPDGAGCAIFNIKALRKLKSVEIVERGRIKRVRGIAFASKVSPVLPKTCATAAKGVLLNLLPDVYVVTDICEKQTQQSGSGFGVVLVAESTAKKCVISQEATASVREPADEVGKRAAHLLLDQVMEGGCIDAHHQALMLLLMANTPDDVSTIRLGRLTNAGVSALALTENFFGVTSAIKEEPSGVGEEGEFPGSTLVTCIGCNTVNLSKPSG